MEKRYFGYGLIVLGMALILTKPISGITGFAIADSVSEIGDAWFYVVGALFVVAGLVMTTSTKTGETLEERLHFFTKGNGNTKDPRHLMMSDPKMNFSKVGMVSLSEMRREVRAYQEAHEEELLDIARGEYGPAMVKRIEEEKELPIALRFYSVLFGKPYRIEPRNIAGDEYEKIKTAFRAGWGGAPDTRQLEILREYGCEFSNVADSKGHKRIYWPENSSMFISVSSTPGDANAGEAIGRDFARNLLPRIYKEIAEKKNKRYELLEKETSD